MILARPILALLVAASSLVGCAQSGVIGGADYAPQYDYGEFFAVTDGRNFQVIVSGNPFPGLPEAEMKRRLLPVMQANKPRPNLTFTYQAPPERPHPDYRMVLVFNAANDLTAARVCAGEVWHKPAAARPFDLFAVYCRDDLALSQTTAWTMANGPDDPAVGQLFAQLFLVLFSDMPPRRFRPRPFMRW